MILTAVQHDIGGGLVYLKCEDKEKLINFQNLTNSLNSENDIPRQIK